MIPKVIVTPPRSAGVVSQLATNAGIELLPAEASSNRVVLE
jgi:hypothetical protein